MNFRKQWAKETSTYLPNVIHSQYIDCLGNDTLLRITQHSVNTKKV